MNEEVSKISICKVSTIQDNLVLDRLFDIDLSDDTIEKPFIVDYKPYQYENRTWLYKNDGPDNLGFIGVWKWIAKPNINSDRDYVRSEYITDIKPTYVLLFNDVDDMEMLISKVKNGIRSRVSLAINNSILAYKKPIGGFEGVYINAGLLNENDDVYYLVDNVNALESITFEKEEMVKNKDVVVFKQIHPVTDKKVFVKSVNEAIRAFILKQATWPSFSKLVGGTHAELNLLKDFVTSLDGGVCEYIAGQYGISLEEAQENVNAFKEDALDYFSSDDISTQVLRLLVERNDEIREKFEHIVFEKWKTENQQIIQEKDREITELNGKLEMIKKECDSQKQKIAEGKIEFDEWQKQKEQIKDQIENSIRNKVEEARKNMGSLITEAAYIKELVSTPAKSSGDTSFKEGEYIESENEYTGIVDAYDYLADNLSQAGVDDDYCNSISALLLSAFCNNIPLILAGPNGKEVVDALSVSLYSKTSGVLECNNLDTDSIVNEVNSSQDQIICINDYCNCNITSFIPDILRETDKNVFLLAPYKEDLFIEPKGLYNYALPLLSDMFITDDAMKDWKGHICADELEEYENDEIDKTAYKLFDKMTISQLSKAKYMRLLADAYSIIDDIQGDGVLSFLAAYLPYSVLTEQVNLIMQYIDEESDYDDRTKKEIKRLQNA